MTITNIIKECELLCDQHEVNLLYLVKFGSHLYGTDTENSDSDYKGLFLPSIDNLILNYNQKSITYNSSKGATKNTKEDIDIQLWDVRYWLLDLLKKGDTNALDLLYSYSYDERILYSDTKMDVIFTHPLSVFSPSLASAYIGYVIGQAKKYGIKGSRLGVIKNIYKYLQCIIPNEFLRLKNIVYDILEKFYDESYCFHKIVNGEDALVICGKVHLYSISFDEFYQRIERDYLKYGERAKKAEQNQGVDWKAISHAFRCLMQMRQLYEEKKITFPLKNASKLLDIKLGKYSWKECESEIISELDIVEKLRADCDWDYKNDAFVNRFILNLYWR